LPHRASPRPGLGPGDTSSSDGKFFRAGGQGEARADRNARYGTEPGVLFYTYVTDRFTPFHTKVIAANAGEAAHVVDGLLDYESELVIREHATTAGAVDHLFGLCHLLGFRFAPRIRGLNERRLDSLSSLDPWPTLLACRPASQYPRYRGALGRDTAARCIGYRRRRQCLGHGA
jgi:TnpA family transposase